MPNPDPEDTVPATLEELRPWLREMRRDLRENNEAISRVEANTQAIVETFQAAQGFWKTVGWIGDAGAKIAKVAAVLTLGGAAVWLWVKSILEGRQ